jgi:AcrR family transcriptional regulator
MSTNQTASRGDLTREALLSAAMEVFGRAGFDAAGTRAIAERAGANQALIGYHFGGKKGLYLAVFESIAEQMAQRMLPVGASLRARLEGVDDTTSDHREISLAAMETLIGAFLDMLGQGMESGWVRLVIREQQDPTPAFEILWEGMMKHMLGLLDQLIGLALGQDPDSENTRLRAMTLIGQVMVFVIARTTTNRHLGWDNSLGEDQLAAIRTQINSNIRAQFGGELEQ